MLYSSSVEAKNTGTLANDNKKNAPWVVHDLRASQDRGASISGSNEVIYHLSPRSIANNSIEQRPRNNTIEQRPRNNTTEDQHILVNEPLLDETSAAVNTPFMPPEYSLKCIYWYYRFINPWIRALVVAIPILYFYSVLLSIVTYRNVLYHKETATFQPVPPMTKPMTDPSDGWQPLILADLLYDVIPAIGYESLTYNNWKGFVDASAALPTIIFLIACAVRRDALRLMEFISCQLILFLLMYLVKTITLYPSPSGLDPSCKNPEHGQWGSWIWFNFTVDYCGDQMFSGHTLNTVLPLIMIKRLWYDYVGWNFAWHPQQCADATPQEVCQKYVTFEPKPYHNASANYTDRNADLFMHELHYPGTPEFVARHYVFWWIVVLLWRVICWVWVAALVYGLLRVRQHYTADILVSILVTCLVATNNQLLQLSVRWLYRPNYWNYKRTGLFSFVHLVQPLTKEQANYEERMNFVGRGGIF